VLCVYLLFTLSGAAGLVYQVVWARLLNEIFGVTVYAVTTVLATFLGGLALGGVVLGRAGDRSANPLRFYGLLEVGIAITALIGAWIIAALEPVHIWAANRFAPSSAMLTVVRVLLACVIILPPTFLMGGTLPVITRFFVGQIRRLGKELSLLYGLNTLGAVAGSLAAGFWLIRLVGLHTTLFIAVATNVLVGLGSLLVGSRAGGLAPQRIADRIEGPISPRLARGGIGLLVVIGFSGFASLGFEIFWTRMLVLIVGTSTYAFVTMLASFLVGIALGSFITRLTVDRIRDRRRAFGWVQIGIAASALVSLPVMGHISSDIGQRWLGSLEGSWLALLSARFGLSFLVMLVPTTLIGTTFPLAGALWTREIRSLGGQLGEVYGANTLGNIVGAAVSGFVLLPVFGLQKGLAVLTTLNLVGAVWGLAPSARARRGAPVARALPVLAALGVCAVWLLLWQSRPFVTGTEQPGDRVLYYKEGLVATVKVIQGAPDASRQWMEVDGIVIGQSSGGVDEKQQGLAHFPFLLMPNNPPRRVLSIGLGTGILIGEVAKHPEVKAVDCLEISPAVIEAAHVFDNVNGGVLRNPLVRVINDDGVNYLRRTGDTYDAVISDAKSRTGHGGNALFFSEDYYRLCYDRLGPDGLMIQWVPTDAPPAELRIIIQTFLRVFPHAYAWVAPPYSCYLVGLKQPLVFDVDHIDRELRSPWTSHLRRWGWGSAYDFFAFLTADRASLRLLVGEDEAVNSIEHPILEFYTLADYAMPLFRRGNENVRMLTGTRRYPPQDVTVVGGNQDVLRQVYHAATLFMDGLQLVGSREADLEPTGLHRIEDALALCPTNGAQRFAAADLYYHLAQRKTGADTEQHLGRAVELWPDHADAHLQLGTIRLRQGRLAEAADRLRQALRINPQLRDAHRWLGVVLAREGNFEEAIVHYREALRICPGIADTHHRLGQALAAQDRPEGAVAEYREALQLDPRNADARLSLGYTLGSLGRLDEAIEQLREGLQLRPDSAMARGALGLALMRQGQAAEAIEQYRAARQLKGEWPAVTNALARALAAHRDPSVRNGAEAIALAQGLCRRGGYSNPAYLDTLAAAYAETGRFEQAARTARRALELARSAGHAEAAAQIERRLQLYVSGRPLREGAADDEP